MSEARNKPITKYLLICTCSGQEQKARQALDVIYQDPDQTSLVLVRGSEQISRIAAKHHNDHLKAIGKLHGNFSYFVVMDGDDIIEEWDLVKGKRIA